MATHRPMLYIGAALLVLGLVPHSAQSRSSSARVKRTADDLTNTIKTLSRQLMLQQFYREEQTRSSGASGIKSVRLLDAGSQSFITPTYSSGSFAAMHDHSNYARTLGTGEMIAVLNGVLFRTRHLDYKLRMKSTTSAKYGATEDIPFPDVPPEVLNQTSFAGQIAEMKEWFRAWRDQKYNVRDYRKYFKPVLCYMEGMWTNSNEDVIEESFDSDRHHLDAQSWMDMQEKAMFTSYTGIKDILENYAFLPTAIMNANDDGSVDIAQWNFRVLCHPVSKHLPLDRLRVIDDIQIRMAYDMDLDALKNSRFARFNLKPRNRTSVNEGKYKRTVLDYLMDEVPGADNYQANIVDNVFGDIAYGADSADAIPLNAGYYHRFYRSARSGAMGTKGRHRGYGDENVFMALSTQNKIAGLSVEDCADATNASTCKTWKQRMSFAVPMEVVYMTPLTKWNPHRFKFRGNHRHPAGKAIYVGPNGPRTGGPGVDEAYNGTNTYVHYNTPDGFFGDEVGTNAADTVKDFFHILDRRGNPQKAKASGHRILMNIKDVGILRQRYPVLPLHEDGTSVWKVAQAVANLVLEPNKYRHLLRETTDDGSRDLDSGVQVGQEPVYKETAFETYPSSVETGAHIHKIIVSAADMERLAKGEKVETMTDLVQGSQHDVILSTAERTSTTGETYLVYNMFRCDALKACPDGHKRRLIQV